MFKKINQKNLIIIFVILLAIVAIVHFWDRKKGDKTFDSDILKIDTAAVTAINIYSKTEPKEIVKVVRDNNTWKVESKGKRFPCDTTAVKGMLGTLGQMKATRIAATDQSQWKEFQVTDSAGTLIEIETKNKESRSFRIGKFSYQQPDNPYDRQGKMTTYIRVTGDNKTYAVEGFLSMVFNASANSFRNKTLVSATRNDWTRLTFSYPGDSSFVLSKDSTRWTINGAPCDSAEIANYLNSLNSLSNSMFVDNEPGLAVPSHTLKIEGTNIAAPIELKAFPADSINKFIVTSTLNDGAYFSGEKTKLFQNTFVSKNKFVIVILRTG